MIRIIAGLFGIAAALSTVWRRFGDGPDVLSTWITLCCSVVSLLSLIVWFVVRRRTAPAQDAA